MKLTQYEVDALLLEQEVWRCGAYLLCMDGRLKVRGFRGAKLRIPPNLYRALVEYRTPIMRLLAQRK